MDEVAASNVNGEFHFKNDKYEYILHGELPKNVDKQTLRKSNGYILKVDNKLKP